MNRLFIGTNSDCNLSNVLFLNLYDFDGIAIDNIIPLIVECTPLKCTKYHKHKPLIRQYVILSILNNLLENNKNIINYLKEKNSNLENVKIINCYNVEEVGTNMKLIVKEYDGILNTSGEVKI